MKVGQIVKYIAFPEELDDMEKNGCNRLKVLPAIVTSDWGNGCLNIRVLCDGPRDIWKTSVTQGQQEGQYFE